MPIFDTHCHYNLEPLYSGQPFHFQLKKEDQPLLQQNWQDHWSAAQTASVKWSLIPGAGVTSSQLATKLADQDPHLLASVGIHPLKARQSDLNQGLEKIASLIDQSASIAAIGETGLDLFNINAKQERAAWQNAQETLLIQHIQLAIEYQLTLIIHARDHQEAAYWRILELLAEYWPAQQSVIFHCLSGPIDYVKQALSIKHSYFGFDGNLTFRNATELRDLFNYLNKQAPDRILLETDAPYLAPSPYRGRICQPVMIAETAQFAQEQLDADLQQIYNNSLRAFNVQDEKN